MRCKSCNTNLNDFELTRKHAVTGDFIDECNRCFRWMENEIPVEVRDDLNPFDEITDDDFTDVEDDAEFETWNEDEG